MSLDKAIEHGKERRRPYVGAKALDPACRNHGFCSWCHDDRLHSRVSRERAAEQDISDYTDERWRAR